MKRIAVAESRGQLGLALADVFAPDRVAYVRQSGIEPCPQLHCANANVAAKFVHSDRGTEMRAQTFCDQLDALGVNGSLSRPLVSNDNPFSEAAFKTLEYFRDYPDRFGSLEDARSYFRGFFPAYNFEHRHSGIAMLTPATVHNGDAEAVLRARL